MTSEQRKKIEERLEMMLKTADTVIPDELRRAMELAYLAGADYALYMFAPHWISVEDELPKKDGRYLFYDEVFGPQVSVYYDGCTLVSSITHWMPMPQAPHHIIDANKKVDRVIGTAEHIKTALDVLNKEGGGNENS